MGWVVVIVVFAAFWGFVWGFVCCLLLVGLVWDSGVFDVFGVFWDGFVVGSGSSGAGWDCSVSVWLD